MAPMLSGIVYAPERPSTLRLYTNVARLKSLVSLKRLLPTSPDGDTSKMCKRESAKAADDLI